MLYIKKLRKQPTHSSTNLVINLTETNLTSEKDRLLKKVVSLIVQNLQNENLNVGFLSAELGMTRQSLHNKLKTLTNHSPSDFIRNVKLENAARLLKNKTGNVGEIAYQSGFESISYFSKMFKEKYGVSPSKYASDSK